MKRTLVVSLCLLALGPAAHAQEPTPPDRQAAVQRLLEILKSEPTITEVQRAAVRHYRLETSRIHSMATAARLKGLVPEIEASVDNSLGHSFSNTRDGLYPILPNPDASPNPLNLKERVEGTNDNLTWRVRAVWNFDRLVFNAEALDAKSLTSLQENLLREITTVFFARRRVLANVVLSPPGDDQELFYELMRLDELTANLDSLTGGMFGRRAWQWADADGADGSGSAGSTDAAPVAPKPDRTQ